MRSLVPFFVLALGCSSPFTTETAPARDIVSTDVQAGQGQGGEPSEVISTAGAPSDPAPVGTGGQTALPEGSSGAPGVPAGSGSMPSTAGTGGLADQTIAGMGGKDTNEHPTLGGMGGAPAAGMGGMDVITSGTGGVATAGMGGTSGLPAVAGAGGSPVDEPQCLVRRVLAQDPSLRDDCIVYAVPGCPDVLRLSLPVGSTYEITSTYVPSENSCDIDLSRMTCLTHTMTDHETYPVLFSFKSRLQGEIRITGSTMFSCIGAGKGETCHLCQSTPTSYSIGTLDADDLEVYSFDMQHGGVTTPQSP